MAGDILYAAATSLGGVGLAEVAGQAVTALSDAGMLKQAVVFRYRRPEVPRELVTVVRFLPCKVFSWLPARYYYPMRRDTLDRAGARYLRRHGAALVHGWTHESLKLFQTARELGIPAVLERNYCHPKQSLSILAQEYAARGIAWPPRPQPWLKPWDHWTREQTRVLEECDLADYILLPSRFAYDTFRERGYPPEKLVLIPRGVDPGRFRPGATKDGVFRVLFAGQLGYRKGVPYLLEAWRRLGLKKAELVLVGARHEEIEPLLREYQDIGNIKITGFVPDPADLYARSTVFCFPSLDEGSAKVTYEALAAGLPLVVTPEAGSVAREGVEGLLIPPRQVEPIMAALERLYRHPEEVAEMSRRARERASSFTWDLYRTRLVAFYRQVLEKGSREISWHYDPGVDI